MAKKKNNFKKELLNLIYINIAILLILLSLFNIQSLKKQKVVVLGASDDREYWEKLIDKHPTYRDGWVELGKMDKAKQIDPNYLP